MTSYFPVGLRRWVRAFYGFYRVEYSLAVTQRAQAVLWMIGGTLPLVLLMIWVEMAERLGSIGGYGREDFILYFLFLFLAEQMTPCWAIRYMDRSIKNGDLAPRLLRPIDPIWHLIAQHWGEMSLRLPIVLAIFSLAVIWTHVALPWQRLPIFALATMVAWWVYFTLNYAIASLAFWMESILHFDALLYRLVALFGGMVLPIDLFPAFFGKILLYSPFPYVLYFPAQLALGKLSQAEIAKGFAIALIWIFIGTLAHIYLWRLGKRRFSAVGA